MSVSVSVMAHKSREVYATKLAKQLGAPIIWDEMNDRWDTGRRAWLAHLDTGSDYSLVIQDDAVAPNGLIPGIEKAMVRVPYGSPLVLYMTKTLQWGSIFDLVPDNISYLLMERIWWGVAIVLPTDFISPMLDFCADYPNLQYDHRIGQFFYIHKEPVYYTWPNLVDHRNLPSLVPGRTARRHAPNFVKGRADRVSWDGKIAPIAPPFGVTV